MHEFSKSNKNMGQKSLVLRLKEIT